MLGYQHYVGHHYRPYLHRCTGLTWTSCSATCCLHFLASPPCTFSHALSQTCRYANPNGHQTTMAWAHAARYGIHGIRVRMPRVRSCAHTAHDATHAAACAGNVDLATHSGDGAGNAHFAMHTAGTGNARNFKSSRSDPLRGF